MCRLILDLTNWGSGVANLCHYTVMAVSKEAFCMVERFHGAGTTTWNISGQAYAELIQPIIWFLCNCTVIYQSSVADVARRADDLRNWPGSVSFVHKERDDLILNAGTGSALPERNKVCISLYPQDYAVHQGFEMEWKELCGRGALQSKSLFQIVLLQGQTHKANDRAC